jgi:hypothetical protein
MGVPFPYTGGTFPCPLIEQSSMSLPPAARFSHGVKRRQS